MEIQGTFHSLEPGTEVTVPAGTPYQDEGCELVMLAVSEPPFDATQILYV